MKTILGYPIIADLTASLNASVYLIEDGASMQVIKKVKDTAYARRELEINRRLMSRGARYVARFTRVEAEETWLYMFFDNYKGNLLGEKPTNRNLLFAMLDTGRGLVEQYEAGIANDDVKPDNILVSASGRCVYCDFGGARYLGEPPIENTSDYAAPELLRGESSDATAIYSWALAVEKFATGRIGLPGQGQNIGEIYPWLGKEIGKLLIWCCMPNPSDRPLAKEILLEVIKIVQWSNEHLAADETPMLP